MDSRKLSFDDQAIERAMLSFIGPGWRDCSDSYKSAMRGNMRAAMIAAFPALAQQAQPLTDEMIEAQVESWERSAEWIRGAKWARDRMAQQAQPECCFLSRPCRHGIEITQHGFKYAPPEIPTREMIARTLYEKAPYRQEGRIPTPWTELAILQEPYLDDADSVLALFAPKETT